MSVKYERMLCLKKLLFAQFLHAPVSSMQTLCGAQKQRYGVDYFWTFEDFGAFEIGKEKSGPSIILHLCTSISLK